MKKEIKLLDGSLSYPLEKQGYNLNKKLWTGDALINDPNVIKKIHKDYLVAGVDFISTSTYQISYKTLKEMGYNFNEIKDVFKRSVDLVEDAIKETNNKGEIKIVGSYGPYGASLSDGSEYTGKYNTPDEIIMAYHIENMNIIKVLDIDIILYETIPCLREIEILSRLVEEYEKEVWVSFSCNKDLEFRDGSSIIKACTILSSIENISTIGMNCFSPLIAEEAIKKLKEHSNKKILIYPNSGEIYNNKDKDWYGEKYFDRSMIKKWLALSPDIIGGCCRVGFEDIKNMRKEINFL
ncbi:MAG: homocysteine S-methyltransferase [Pelagibacterales bacterium]|nr:homocysteine S-methyltransferase [Pelagibacterales bacterium]